MGWKGMSDSRPETSKPKPGKLDRSESARSAKKWKGITETFADRREAGGGNWKGQSDSRPDAA
jgi:hypothetical protein